MLTAIVVFDRPFFLCSCFAQSKRWTLNYFVEQTKEVMVSRSRLNSDWSLSIELIDMPYMNNLQTLPKLICPKSQMRPRVPPT